MEVGQLAGGNLSQIPAPLNFKKQKFSRAHDDSTKTASSPPLIKRFSREIMSRAGLCVSDLRLVWITTRRSLHAAFVLSEAINAR